MTLAPAGGPVTPIDAEAGYRRPARGRSVRLALDGNEGAHPPIALYDALRAAGPELLRRYPDATTVERALAVRVGVAPEQVLVTAGADDALDRCCRGYLAPGRTLILPDPTFEMVERFGRLAGAEPVPVSWWEEPFPVDAFLAAIDDRTGAIAVVSPNNPTGWVASLDDLRRLALAAPSTLVILDHAYVEYADRDLTRAAVELPNVVVVRTLSKAWGLAGCRVGYAVASPEVIGVLRAAGGPYPVAGPSLAIAAAQLAGGDEAVRGHVARVREERAGLIRCLGAWGVRTREAQGNFVLAELGCRARFVHQALASLGVFVRAFPDRQGLEGALRITMPGDRTDFERLLFALEAAVAPGALLLDLDGVVADVEGSYRQCVLETVRSYGVEITRAGLLAATLEGDANNDWILTQRLLAERGVSATLEDVTARYQEIYLGSATRPSLRERERLIVPRAVLERLARRLPIGIVTGRPRAEAEWFLERVGVAHVATTLVAMEDARVKPDPAPIRLALEQIGTSAAWMVGDTRDDVQAAVAAGVVPIGVVAPREHRDAVAPVLLEAGAATVLEALTELEDMLP